MPFLSAEDRERFAARRKCPFCEQDIHNEYCSRCDEFFSVGHAADCRLKPKPEDEHTAATCGGDRGYR